MAAKLAPDQETRRADIRAAALRLMAEVGFEAATPSVIAAAIGRPTHRVLYYYGSFEKILDECANLHMYAHLTRTATDEIAALPGAERLHALAGAYAAAIAEDTMSHRALAYYVPCLSPGHQASVRTRMRWLACTFVLALTEAAPDLPAERAKPLALSLLAMLNAQAVWFREGGGMLREDSTTMAVRLVLAEAGVAPRPARGRGPRLAGTAAS